MVVGPAGRNGGACQSLPLLLANAPFTVIPGREANDERRRPPHTARIAAKSTTTGSTPTAARNLANPSPLRVVVALLVRG